MQIKQLQFSTSKKKKKKIAGEPTSNEVGEHMCPASSVALPPALYNLQNVPVMVRK